MTDNIIIRKANNDDLEAILELINSPQADNGTAMESRDANTIYQSILEDPNYFQIVASSENGIIGMVTLVIIMQMSHEGTTSALITDLITVENDNSAEIATQLLLYTTNLAQEYGCYKTILHSDYQLSQTASAAQALGLKPGEPCYILPEE